MRCVVLVLLALGFLGCKSMEQKPSARVGPNTESISLRNNSASLLYQLLGDEKHVGKLLLIKRDRKELHELITRISAVAGEAVKMLEGFGKVDSSLQLEMTSLPPGEKAAREYQSSRITKQLLKSKGEEFEFELLMAQAQALGYGSSLAEVAAENETSAKRREQLKVLAAELSRLEKDVIRMLKSL